MTQDEFNEMLEISLSTMTASVDGNDIETINNVNELEDNTTMSVVNKASGVAQVYKQVTAPFCP